LVGVAEGLGVALTVGLADPSGVGDSVGDAVGLAVTLGEGDPEGEADGVTLAGGEGTPEVGAVWPQAVSASAAATVATSTDRFTGRISAPSVAAAAGDL
jgi:hypothetical protein